MAHIPTQESNVEKVYRIAKELDIGIDKASITCDAFELAFSDLASRSAIFGMIDQLDESAAKKGEPLGLIIRYTVELGEEGIRVGRYADEIPPGQVVELTPTDRAMIFLKIKDNFPTQQFLGPLTVNRPACVSEPRAVRGPHTGIPDGVQVATGIFSEGGPAGRGGLTDTEITESEIPNDLPSEWTEAVIYLGPIRLKLEERFPFISSNVSRSQRTGAMSFFNSAGCTALNQPHHLTPWAALPAGMPAFHSGLSPPRPSENLGHSDRKMSLRHWQ